MLETKTTSWTLEQIKTSSSHLKKGGCATIMIYGFPIWRTRSSENLEFRLQKRAARITLEIVTRERSAKLFKALNWLPLQEETEIQKCCVIHNRHFGQCTQYMKQWNNCLLETSTIVPDQIDIRH